MDINKFTDKAHEVMSSSQEIAIRLGHQQVDGEHIHLALLNQEEGLIPRLVSYMDINFDIYKSDVERVLEKLPRCSGSGASSLYATRRFNEIMIHARMRQRNSR
jgi:ATP-dependent Clp protease ATP-binding subunit ClpB